MGVDIVELPVDPVGDPGGRKLAVAIRAHFELEKATRHRRRWTGALALMSIPAILAVAFPSFLGERVRLVELALWLCCATSCAVSFVTEVRWYRLVQRATVVARAALPPAG